MVRLNQVTLSLAVSANLPRLLWSVLVVPVWRAASAHVVALLESNQLLVGFDSVKETCHGFHGLEIIQPSATFPCVEAFYDAPPSDKYGLSLSNFHFCHCYAPLSFAGG